ncbi:YbhB/YbcL family Raf kinase inhibitor-like protein [Phenylobacterium deserti]|uniref:YbhB/YbcL family Raf kinase inhibitor-like protein n=1 Tax=Phenylobacterium deserti TaxID=1914756 RepID=A0A328AQF2_9CAUL|nr:YbhB/YbcL family Raf kinase inhibitor-like protein [Phenylobacterium deserti]RAK56541.1 YbhB/YbcL family Raf kinase inhibitor-like protein [Phenylobacterium deserti]
MLEKIPSAVGRALRSARAGYGKVVSEQPAFVGAPQSIDLESPEFEDGSSIPPRFTADGDQISPPLAWRSLPEETQGLVLIVEDPDAPANDPLVHLLAWDLPPELEVLPEGEFKSPRHAGLDEVLGRNSYLQTAWLPPDPPRGHGPHLYVFQLFALDRKLSFDHAPSRGAVVEAMSGHVLAKGVLVATYERT